MSYSSSTTAKAAPSREGFSDGMRASVPVVLGYLSIGLAAGVIERAAGMSLMEIGLISLLLFAGSAQFITAGMLSAGATAAGIVPTVFFVNLRHLLLSAAVAPYFQRLPAWQNALIGTELTDETFAVSSHHLAGRQSGSAAWMFGLNLTSHLSWIIANIAGGLFGEIISDAAAWGLDFALPAMFAGLLVLQLRGRADRSLGIGVGLIAAVLAVWISLTLPGAYSTILATVFAATAGMVMEQWKSGRRSS